ncbi:MAG: hypothetical protein EAZ65_04740 [Verrucomicrobia bacterium]|nr:MAG: hypothetical protein EAZ84_13485 [Verrucomicrobiota bacterium]TAE88045.1 MAG: hypothetical protein EAZ82_05995 [Verrucomicrobiota bacterium]TAF26268.1 MAG: hypothetical protein EAZ71_05560 [Verrucomicrobiota bacterium]TAF41825.1 MAG: hypothetical protein EAZ65_04740 [Verrucomicrobiota bacterium]
MPDPQSKQEHPLANILINVLIPVMVLSYLSKDPEIQVKLGKEVKPWHLGPLWAMIIALIPPLAYGIWHFIKTKHGNIFSALGFVSVLLTGGLTFYLWNADGSVKANAGLLFGIKEASIPLVLAFAIISSHKSASPLIRVFLYNDSIFDIARIERRVNERGAAEGYDRLLREATRFFAGSFVLSAAMNLGLALWFFRSFDSSAVEALENYNGIVAKLTGWSFAVIGLPVLVILFLILTRLLRGLRALTGLDDKELMHPR